MEPGESAARPVVLVFKSARALAPILLRLMAAHNVQDPTKKLSSVIKALVQVSKRTLPSPPRSNWPVPELLPIDCGLRMTNLLFPLFDFS